MLLQALSELPDKRSAARQSMAILAAPEGKSDVVMLAALAVRAAISWDEGRLAEGLELSRQAVARVKRDPLDARAFQPYLDLASTPKAATDGAQARCHGRGYRVRGEAVSRRPGCRRLAVMR